MHRLAPVLPTWTMAKWAWPGEVKPVRPAAKSIRELVAFTRRPFWSAAPSAATRNASAYATMNPMLYASSISPARADFLAGTQGRPAAAARCIHRQFRRYPLGVVQTRERWHRESEVGTAGHRLRATRRSRRCRRRSRGTVSTVNVALALPASLSTLVTRTSQDRTPAKLSLRALRRTAWANFALTNVNVSSTVSFRSIKATSSSVSVTPALTSGRSPWKSITTSPDVTDSAAKILCIPIAHGPRPRPTQRARTPARPRRRPPKFDFQPWFLASCVVAPSLIKLGRVDIMR